jgi:hypothetical protein
VHPADAAVWTAFPFALSAAFQTLRRGRIFFKRHGMDIRAKSHRRKEESDVTRVKLVTTTAYSLCLTCHPDKNAAEIKGTVHNADPSITGRAVARWSAKRC